MGDNRFNGYLVIARFARYKGLRRVWPGPQQLFGSPIIYVSLQQKRLCLPVGFIAFATECLPHRSTDFNPRHVHTPNTLGASTERKPRLMLIMSDNRI